MYMCAGMAYVGGLLLMSMEEEDTFWALVSLFDRPKYLSGYYNHSMDRCVILLALFLWICAACIPIFQKCTVLMCQPYKSLE